MTVIVVEKRSTTVLSVGQQGPAGVPENAIMYRKKYEPVDSVTAYKGEAAPGSPTSSAVWRIRRYTFSPSGPIEEDWADGTDAFTKTWDARASYAYGPIP